jgi:hypothetical protein
VSAFDENRSALREMREAELDAAQATGDQSTAVGEG